MNLEIYYARSKKHWRDWLVRNHIRTQSIWLRYYKKSINKPSLSWSEAVDEALCFGWIDSVKKTYDSESYIQCFSKRKEKSIWSKINKNKIKILQKQGLIFPAGLAAVATAKKNGSWIFLDEIEEGVVPSDLQSALEKAKLVSQFNQLSPSLRKQYLVSIKSARLANTRINRIQLTCNYLQKNP
ncbi:MAG: YdeI/OmpD-associated family protein [Methylacidiphilales bacterium]|nr:YdeI/OmpD-associated family protein [Candidatus Methylacidiphilales bacterium]